MSPAESDIQHLSFEHFSENPDDLILELSLIPSSMAQRLCQYASSFSREERLSLVKGLYSRIGIGGRTNIVQAADLESVERFEQWADDSRCTWERLPASMRQTLQTMVQRTGRISPQFLSPENGITEESIRRSESIVLPTERQLKAFLRREFNGTTDWKEPSGAKSYRIAEVGSYVRLQTLVGYSQGGRVITCFHQFLDDRNRGQQFCLFPYGLHTGAVIFDLIDANSIERLANPLRRITSVFEGLVNKLAL